MTGSVYALGGSIDLLEPAEIEHSLYFIGLSINFEEGATIVRDLNALSLGAVIRGTVERETFAVVGLIKILRIIFDRTQAVESRDGRPAPTKQPAAQAYCRQDKTAAPNDGAAAARHLPIAHPNRRGRNDNQSCRGRLVLEPPARSDPTAAAGAALPVDCTNASEPGSQLAAPQTPSLHWARAGGHHHRLSHHPASCIAGQTRWSCYFSHWVYRR